MLLRVLALLLILAVAVSACKDKQPAPTATNPATATDLEEQAPDAEQAADVAEVIERAEPTEPAVDTTMLSSLSLGDAFVTAGRTDGPELLLRAPSDATASAKLGRVVVESKDGFAMEIAQGTADIATYRANISENPINTLVAFHDDEPDTLLYETKALDQTQFHFVATLQVGEEHFTCENVKGVAFDRAQVTQMLASCRTLKTR